MYNTQYRDGLYNNNGSAWHAPDVQHNTMHTGDSGPPNEVYITQQHYQHDREEDECASSQRGMFRGLQQHTRHNQDIYFEEGNPHLDNVAYKDISPSVLFGDNDNYTLSDFSSRNGNH